MSKRGPVSLRLAIEYLAHIIAQALLTVVGGRKTAGRRVYSIVPTNCQTWFQNLGTRPPGVIIPMSAPAVGRLLRPALLYRHLAPKRGAMLEIADRDVMAYAGSQNELVRTMCAIGRCKV